MNPPLTTRLLRATIIGLLGGGIYFFASWLVVCKIFNGNERWAFLSMQVAFYSFILNIIGYFIYDWSLRAKWYLKPILWGVLLIAVFVWYLHMLKAMIPFVTKDYQAFVPYWRDILEHYMLFAGIGYIIAMIPHYWVYYKDQLRENKYFRQWFVENKGAGGSFGGLASFRRNTIKLQGRWSKSGHRTNHIILGRSLFMDDPEMRLIMDKNNSHNIVCASARSGKSVTCIYNILCTHTSPVIVFDPRGEHARQSFYRRSSQEFLAGIGLKGKARKHLKGGRAYVLDPFAETDIPSAFYNPLSEISIEDLRVREKITAISDAIVTSETGDAKHFEEYAKYLIEGSIAYALGNFSKHNQNLVFIYNMINGIDQEIGVARTEKFHEFLVRMQMDTVSAGGLPAGAASKLLEMGERERGSVLSTVARSLKWISDPAMRKQLTGQSSFRFSDIGQSKAVTHTIYVVLPEGLMSQSGQLRWFRMITNLGIVLLRNRPNIQKLPTTLFIIDEFARLGKVQMISEGISTLMGDKIKLHIALQNLGQLKHDYPERWNSFIANSSIQFFGVNDLETAKYVSERLGERTEKQKMRNGEVRKEKIPLMTPQEIMVFLGKERNRQIVFPVDGLPMRLERVGYKKIKNFNAIGGLRGHYEF